LSTDIRPVGGLKRPRRPADTPSVTTGTTVIGRHGTRTDRVRRALALLVSGVVLLLPLHVKRAEAVSDDEGGFARMVNDVRSRNGVRQLKVTDRLSSLARRHSERMAERGELYHSNLRRVFRGFNYQMVGENVGYGGSLDQLLQAFMNSAAHRQNIVGNWHKTGVGVYWQGDQVWVTQLFYR
jgi:uncharacterized protein YkwD